MASWLWMATTSCLSSVTRTAFAPRPMHDLVQDSALALAPLAPHLSSTIQPVMVLSAAHDATANRSTKAVNRGNSFLMIILFHSGRGRGYPHNRIPEVREGYTKGDKGSSQRVSAQRSKRTPQRFSAVALEGGVDRFCPGSR